MTEDETFERLKRFPIKEAFRIFIADECKDAYNCIPHRLTLDSFIRWSIANQAENKSHLDYFLISSHLREKILYLTSWQYEEFNNAIVELVEKHPLFNGWNNNVRPFV